VTKNASKGAVYEALGASPATESGGKDFRTNNEELVEKLGKQVFGL